MEPQPSAVRIERIKDNIIVSVDRSLIITSARPSLCKFLLNLQVYKSTANVTDGVSYFEKYAEVDELFASYREIVIQHLPCRIQYVQPNTFHWEGEVRLREYPATREGLIESWAERAI